MGGYSWLRDILALRYLWLWDIWFLGGVLVIEAHLALGWGICGCGTFVLGVSGCGIFVFGGVCGSGIFGFGYLWLWDI